MRVSVPSLPHVISTHAHGVGTSTTKTEAVQKIASFLAHGDVAVITGAGVSVDSGIRAYRGDNGRYLNPNYKPIFYHELMDPTRKGFSFRQRYWLRSYLGYIPIRTALPNPTHYALAALQYANVVPRLITQNVDGLHHKSLEEVWDRRTVEERVLELHGTLHKVHCSLGHVIDRDTFQHWLSAANPQWKAFADEFERTGQRPRTNPDGDVVLEGVNYDGFVVPECPQCLLKGKRNSTQKPEVIFFGESIRPQVRDRSFADISNTSRLLLIGTTLATFSAFRLFKHAVELNKPVLILNVGPTRADGYISSGVGSGMEAMTTATAVAAMTAVKSRGKVEVEKVEVKSGDVMREVAELVLGSEAYANPTISDLLSSGVVRPPPDEGEVDS